MPPLKDLSCNNTLSDSSDILNSSTLRKKHQEKRILHTRLKEISSTLLIGETYFLKEFCFIQSVIIKILLNIHVLNKVIDILEPPNILSITRNSFIEYGIILHFSPPIIAKTIRYENFIKVSTNKVIDSNKLIISSPYHISNDKHLITIMSSVDNFPNNNLLDDICENISYLCWNGGSQNGIQNVPSTNYPQQSLPRSLSSSHFLTHSPNYRERIFGKQNQNTEIPLKLASNTKSSKICITDDASFPMVTENITLTKSQVAKVIGTNGDAVASIRQIVPNVVIKILPITKRLTHYEQDNPNIVDQTVVIAGNLPGVAIATQLLLQSVAQ